MSAKHPDTTVSPPESTKRSDNASLTSKEDSELRTPTEKAPTLPLAPLAVHEHQKMEGVLGDAVLRFFRIRKGPKGDQYDADAVCIQNIGRDVKRLMLIGCNTNQYLGL